MVNINQSGGHSCTGDLFNNTLWYPGKEGQGIIRIVNNYKNASIKDLGLNVAIKYFKDGLERDTVYNSFIDNMRLTIKKKKLLSESTIVEDKSLADLLRDGIDFPADTLNIGNTMDFRYTLKMDEAATDELESMSASVDFTFNAKEITENGGGGDNGGGNGGNGGGSGNTPTPPKTKTFDGDLIDRMPGYIALNKPTEIKELKNEVILPFNIETLRANGGHTARVYYWHESLEKWIALATYPNTTYTVRAINDGGYTGWFNVFGVIQPNFNDLILGHWAEPVTNRMNGLGIIEGYPGDGLIRPAQLEQAITRTEFTTLIYRLLNINPDKQILKPYELSEAKKNLLEYYQDAKEIPDWVAGVVFSATEVGLVEARAGKFVPNEPITQKEAARMINKAFKILENHQSVDLTQFKTAQDIPDWAKIAVADKVLGYPDYTQGFITRAEALTVLKRLFVIGMGL